MNPAVKPHAPGRISAAVQLAAMVVALCVSICGAQESAPVIIDSSPMATELLRRARELAATNPVESARSLQEAVDGFPFKLVPRSDSTDRFQMTPAAAEQLLLDNDSVRQCWLKAESTTAQRRLEQGEFLQVAQLRAFTPAGLMAMFTLAQQDLDQGRVASAAHWLEKALRHPSLEPAQKKLLEQTLRDIADPDEPPAEVASSATGQQGIEPWRPLWSEWLSESWLNRSILDMDSKAVAQAQSSAMVDGSALVATARFTADGVLVADGSTVRLLDPLSGLTRWQRMVDSPNTRANLAPSDLAVAVCFGDVAITLPGHALTEQRSGAQSKITALSLKNGSILWEAHLNRMGHDEFSELFPHGDPVIVDDVVVVQARKSNSRLESVEWLVALDLETGALRWANSLGAAGGVRLTVSRPLSSPTNWRGDIIAATSLGVVARVDPSNGHILWLRRWAPPLREPRGSNPAWQLPSPVVDQDCVYWIAPDQNTLVCMRALDGSTKWSAMLGINEQLPAARSLLVDDERLYLLGEDVVAIDREDPRHILWRLSSQFDQRIAVRGECALERDGPGRTILAVPLQDKAVLIDSATGILIGELPLEAGGNLALQDGQLVVVDAQQVSLSMQASHGERLLRARLLENPGDPRRGLALFEFGAAWERPELMLEGANSLAQAFTKGDKELSLSRDEVIGKLLSALSKHKIDSTTQTKLLSIAKACAESPSQQASVALLMGDLAAQQGQWSTALDQWVSIVESQEMGGELVGNETRKYSARVAALERILSREPHALEPQRGTAAFHAAQRMRSCDGLEFMRAVHLAALLARSPAESRQILREAAQRAHDMGWLDFESMCRAMEADNPERVRWPRDIAPAQFAKLGPAQPVATTIAGRLLAMSSEAQRERSHASVLFAEPTSLVLRGSDNLDIQWRSSFGDRDPVAMCMRPHIVLWCPQSHEDGALLALDPGNGKTVWRVDSAAGLFETTKVLQGESEPAAGAKSTAILCLRSGPVCALIRTNGQVVGVNNETGATQWKSDCDVHDVDSMDSSSTLVAVAGLEIESQDELVGNPTLIQLLSPSNGETKARRVLPEDWGRTRWMRVLPDCLLVATDAVVAALELAPGLPTRWIQQDRRYQDSPPAQIAGSMCMVNERSGNSTSMDLSTGATNPLVFTNPPSGEWEANLKISQPSFFPYRDQWLALRSQRLGLYNEEGALQGEDAVAVDRRYEHLIPGMETVFVVDSVRPDFVDEHSIGFLFLLREFHPGEGLRAASAPIQVRTSFGRITRADAIDGWILLGGDEKTMAIPAPFSH